MTIDNGNIGCDELNVLYNNVVGKDCSYVDSEDIDESKGIYSLVVYKDGTIRETS